MTLPDHDRDESPSSPLFLPPENPPALPPGPPSSTTRSSTSDRPTPDLEPNPLELEGAGDGSRSEPRSTGKGRRGAKLRELRKIMQGAVETAGGIAHTILTARNPLEREYGVWLPDEDDVENIAEPLASLASRRTPAAVDNPDTVDLVALGMALFGFVMKNLAARSVLAEQHPDYYGAPAVDVVPGAVDDLPDQVPPPAAPVEPVPPVSPARMHLGRRGSLLDDVVDGAGYDPDGRGAE